MHNQTITDNKTFMRHLLIDDTFDNFLLARCDVKMNVTYSINGMVNGAFYDSDELDALSSREYALWRDVKPHVYGMIKGNKLPLGFKIIFLLSDANVAKLISRHNLHFTPDQIANLSLNIYFDGENISVTSMATLKTFSMDKTLEMAWDEDIARLMKSCVGNL